jgi:hypothetical protein
MSGSASNFLINKILDFVMRGQSYTPPTEVFIGLATTTGSQAAPGTEVSGGSYARVGVPTSLIDWSGTQGATTTAVSSGTSGTISNNVLLTFPAPTANWSIIVEFDVFDVFDAETGGNLLFRAALTASQTINNGAPAPSFEISALTWTID